ncbi:Uncharacterized protein GBIM_03665 [Gryllus bimaculatus]|nr:Uncharacterized protein GBIM_03665 [Gryllus bimaculatus]
MIKLSGLVNNQWVSEPINIKSYFEEYEEKLSLAIKALQTSGVDNYNLETMSSNNEERGKSDLTVKKDVVITIRVHDTVYPVENYPKPAKPFSQEMMVLGSQSLTCLRDKIICTTDYRATHSETEKMIFEDEEERKNHLRAKDQFKSGLFFFEDTFYNDMRHPANIDYSKVIREWAERKKIGPLHEGSMAETKFEDLTIRFGYPYVYQHQGNCEHLIIFSDASLLHESDVCEKKRYPVVKSIGTKTNLSCMICHYYHARWITFGNERVPVDPCYFCDQCFKSYNYIGKEKIGKFKVYEYHPFFPFHDKLFSK